MCIYGLRTRQDSDLGLTNRHGVCFVIPVTDSDKGARRLWNRNICTSVTFVSFVARTPEETRLIFIVKLLYILVSKWRGLAQHYWKM